MNRPQRTPPLSRLLIGLLLITLTGFASGILLPRFLDLPRAAPLHLVFALGILPLILGTMTFFIPVLTRSGNPEPRALAAPLIGLLAGVMLAYALFFSFRLYPVAALLALAAVIRILWWSRGRSRNTLGQPHPGLLWYQLALVSLATGLVAILAGYLWPELWIPLRRIHLHLNLLGFIGLTALGTLRVLLPTAGSFADDGSHRWLATAWKPMAAGTLLIAIGSAWSPVMAVAGAILWIAPLPGFFRQTLIGRRQQIWTGTGATPSLAMALPGLLLAMTHGFAHALGWTPTPQASTIFILAFLLPLVTGAATQLLPMWLIPGNRGEEQQQLRDRLGQLGLLRATLFLASGVFAFAGVDRSHLPALLALAHFLVMLGMALSAQTGKGDD